MPDPVRSDAREWAEYVFFHNNDAGVVTEWWCHTASSYWFLAERNTVSDEIIRTFAANEVFKERIEFASDTGAEEK